MPEKTIRFFILSTLFNPLIIKMYEAKTVFEEMLKGKTDHDLAFDACDNADFCTD